MSCWGKFKKGFCFVFFPITICLIILSGLIFAISSTNYKKNKYKGQTEAYKIEAIKSYDSDGTYYYTPIYYFKALNGTKLANYRCVSKSLSNSYPDKSENKVYYNIDNQMSV